MPIGGTAFLGQNQSPRITTNYLNQLSRTGDPAPGVPVSTQQVSGSIVQPYYGMVGGKTTITNPWAAQFADPAVGPLYGGTIQYVQFSPSMPSPAVRGAICFWADELNYIVTTVYNATTAYKIAGVIINPDLPGNWDFIYIGGIAMALFGAPVTMGNMVGASTTGPPAMATAAATAGPTLIGVAVMANGASGVVSPVELNILAGWNN